MAKQYYWTRVEHELPDGLADVLVWGPGHNVMPATYYQEMGEGDPAGFYLEECGYDGAEQELIDWVTHWMLFPEPPKV